MQRLGIGRVALARACKAVLVGIVALLIALVAVGNLTNYDANLPFVRHVLAMDTIFPGSHLGWRAITNREIQTVAYLGIIVWEIACAIITGIAAIRLAFNARSGERFLAAVPLAFLGLTMIMVLFGGGFLAIGGEWFLMWQSTTWNGTEPATRYFAVASLTLIILLSPDGTEDPTPRAQ